MKILITYWLLTTIYGTYWLIKNPSSRLYKDKEYFTLLELIGNLFMALIFAWFFVPLYLLSFFKFKR